MLKIDTEFTLSSQNLLDLAFLTESTELPAGCCWNVHLILFGDRWNLLQFRLTQTAEKKSKYSKF